jgi:hypothetical protein
MKLNLDLFDQPTSDILQKIVKDALSKGGDNIPSRYRKMIETNAVYTWKCLISDGEELVDFYRILCAALHSMFVAGIGMKHLNPNVVVMEVELERENGESPNVG